MKRRYSICMLVSILIINCFASGCGGSYEQTVEKTLEEAKEVNYSSNLGMEFLKLSNMTKEEIRSSGLLLYTELTEDDNIKGYYFPYPYKDSESRLTHIYLKGGNYHVFGIKVGDKVDDAVGVLEQRGYREKKLKNRTDQREFTKYDVRVHFYIDSTSNTIVKIMLATEIHYKGSTY